MSAAQAHGERSCLPRALHLCRPRAWVLSPPTVPLRLLHAQGPHRRRCSLTLLVLDSIAACSVCLALRVCASSLAAVARGGPWRGACACRAGRLREKKQPPQHSSTSSTTASGLLLLHGLDLRDLGVHHGQLLGRLGLQRLGLRHVLLHRSRAREATGAAGEPRCVCGLGAGRGKPSRPRRTCDAFSMNLGLLSRPLMPSRSCTRTHAWRALSWLLALCVLWTNQRTHTGDAATGDGARARKPCPKSPPTHLLQLGALLVEPRQLLGHVKQARHRDDHLGARTHARARSRPWQCEPTLSTVLHVHGQGAARGFTCTPSLTTTVTLLPAPPLDVGAATACVLEGSSLHSMAMTCADADAHASAAQARTTTARSKSGARGRWSKARCGQTAPVLRAPAAPVQVLGHPPG